MIKTHFIECILGEPLTAIDSLNNYIAFGSISGYYGMYDKNTRKSIFCNQVENELI